MNDTVLYERRGHIAILTLNRPERLNALSAEVAQGMAEAWVRYAGDEDAWIAILAANGRAFSSGVDVKEQSEARNGRWGMASPSVRDPFWHEELDKPTIAAVNGYAYGGGFFLAARADLRVAEESARFQITEIIRSSLAGYQMELSQNLPAAIAAELAAGEILTAARAYDVGFVNRLVPDGQALAAALELAEGILERPPLAIDYNLRLARRLRSRRVPDDVFAQAKAWQAEVLASQDRRESIQAFLEKRRPVYRRQ